MHPLYFPVISSSLPSLTFSLFFFLCVIFSSPLFLFYILVTWNHRNFPDSLFWFPFPRIPSSFHFCALVSSFLFIISSSLYFVLFLTSPSFSPIHSSLFLSSPPCSNFFPTDFVSQHFHWLYFFLPCLLSFFITCTPSLPSGHSFPSPLSH